MIYMLQELYVYIYIYIYTHAYTNNTIRRAGGGEASADGGGAGGRQLLPETLISLIYYITLSYNTFACVYICFNVENEHPPAAARNPYGR